MSTCNFGKDKFTGSVAKNQSILQNRWKPSQ